MSLNNVVITDPDNKFNPYDAAHPIPVEIKAGGGGGGDATAALQTAGNASLTSIAGNITACDTGSVVISSGAVNAACTGDFYPSTQPVSGTFFQSTQPISGSVSAACTGDFYPSTQPVSGSFYPATQPVSGSVSAAVSGSVAVSAVSGTVDVDGTVAVSAVAGSVAVTNDGLADLEDKAVLNLGGAVAVAPRVQICGLAGSALSTMVLDSTNGSLTVTEQDAGAVVNQGSYANLASNVTIAAGATSSTVNVANMNVCNVFYEDSSTASSDQIKILASPDNSHFFELVEIFTSLNTAGTKREGGASGLNVQGLTHLKLENASSAISNTNVYGTVVGSK